MLNVMDVGGESPWNLTGRFTRCSRAGFYLHVGSVWFVDFDGFVEFGRSPVGGSAVNGEGGEGAKWTGGN